MNVCHRHPSMTKKFQIFGGVSRRAGRAWGGRMGWERVDAPRRGRRGYFARRAVVEPTSGPSGCGWENGRGRCGCGWDNGRGRCGCGRENGRGQVGAGGTMVGADVPGGPPPARNAAGRPTTEPRAGVGCRRARGTRAPTNVGVLMCQGQPTWGARADAPRRGRLGYFARQAVGGRLWIWPWVGCWSTAAQGPAATSAALPCGRGCRGRAISRRSSSAGSIRGAAAREVPAPPSARDVQADPAQGPAATSAALPCGRGCRGRGCKGRGISRRSSSEVKSRIPKPAAGGPQLCGPQELIAEAMTSFRLRFWP